MRMISASRTVFALGIAAAAYGAQANCTTDLPINGSNISNTLVCAYKPASGGTDPNQRWSEIHNSATDDGPVVTLGEHGRGTNDPQGSYDADIGTWGYSGSTINYSYTGDGSYSWTLHGSGTTPTSFCDGTTEIARIQTVIPGIPASTLPNPCGW